MRTVAGWIPGEPRLAVWDYVDRNYVPRRETSQLEHMKDFARPGGQLDFKYHILEGFAYDWSDDAIKEFVDSSQALQEPPDYGAGTTR